MTSFLTIYVRISPSYRGTIIWHVDKDESVASNKYYLSHPTLGSILYLTSTGGPTAITNQWSPEGNGYTPELPDSGVLSFPEVNKYAVFHGELLHGVLPGKHGDEGYRLTFLVNWWSYKPEEPNCSVFPYEKVPSIPRYTPAQLEQLKNTFTFNYDNYRLKDVNVAAPKRAPGTEFVSYMGKPNNPDNIIPIRAPGPLVHIRDHQENMLIDYPGNIQNPNVETSPVPTYIYTYNLPGGVTRSLRIPQGWFPGQSVWLIWNPAHVHTLQAHRQIERSNLQQRLQQLEHSRAGAALPSPPVITHTSDAVPRAAATPTASSAHIVSRSPVELDVQRRARVERDRELLRKTEL